MIVVGWTTCDRSQEHQEALRIRDALLSHYLRVSDPSRIVRRTERGRPCLTVSGADFSVSHSDGTVVVAVSLPDGRPETEYRPDGFRVCSLELPACRIGIDAESLDGKSAERCERIAERFFTAAERQMVKTAPKPTEAFVRLWTQKESLCKMTGTGLAGLQRADTQTLPDGVTVLSRRCEWEGKACYVSLCVSGREN